MNTCVRVLGRARWGGGRKKSRPLHHKKLTSLLPKPKTWQVSLCRREKGSQRIQQKTWPWHYPQLKVTLMLSFQGPSGFEAESVTPKFQIAPSFPTQRDNSFLTCWGASWRGVLGTQLCCSCGRLNNCSATLEWRQACVNTSVHYQAQLCRALRQTLGGWAGDSSLPSNPEGRGVAFTTEILSSNSLTLSHNTHFQGSATWESAVRDFSYTKLLLNRHNHHGKEVKLSSVYSEDMGTVRSSDQPRSLFVGGRASTWVLARPSPKPSCPCCGALYCCAALVATVVCSCPELRSGPPAPPPQPCLPQCPCEALLSWSRVSLLGSASTQLPQVTILCITNSSGNFQIFPSRESHLILPHILVHRLNF
jgi:hypothetical protein